MSFLHISEVFYSDIVDKIQINLDPVILILFATRIKFKSFEFDVLGFMDKPVSFRV